jgi:hypothetical protein
MKHWGWVLLMAASVLNAQPMPPELTLEGGSVVPGGRFEFAKIPELALIRGIPQVVQLGFYQIDPGNPWAAGDVERKTGWLSNHPTQLVDATTGTPVVTNIVTYHEQTAELKYNGTWSGDVTVRIKKIGTSVQSEPFRIRVLTPMNVWGDQAAEINEQKGWNAVVCLRTFSECRQVFRGGTTDVAPLVVFITPGTYGGQDWYISSRRYSYILGDPNNRPTLLGDEISGSRKSMFYIANLNMKDAGILHSGALVGYPNTIIVRSVYQCCETRDNNGIFNPNGTTGEDVWSVYWHASESKGMGGAGNTTHAAYIEGRPKSLFDVNNVRFLGTRGSSAVKTTMNELNVRHSHFQVAESMEDLENGVCIHPGPATGCLMHTPIDVPGYSNVTVYANRFLVWRGPTVGVGTARGGILAGAIFIRNRANSLGSDTPNYPNTSWNPPVSTQRTKLPPCLRWDGTAATFVADNFWRDIRSKPLDSETNPCTFKHFVSFNHFVQLPGSLGVYALRDDGTYPNVVTSQFATTINILRNHPLWAERSTNFLYGNTYEGFDEKRSLYQLNREPNVRNIAPLAYWPRQGPDDFPRVNEVKGELPPWFKL